MVSTSLIARLLSRYGQNNVSEVWRPNVRQGFKGRRLPKVLLYPPGQAVDSIGENCIGDILETVWNIARLGQRTESSRRIMMSNVIYERWYKSLAID